MYIFFYVNNEITVLNSKVTTMNLCVSGLIFFFSVGEGKDNNPGKLIFKPCFLVQSAVESNQWT